jgi:hypothetical protein
LNYKDKVQGVFIHKDFFKIEDLSLPQKMIYAKVCLLDNENGCYASNGYLANFFNISNRQVSAHISNLVNKGYLNIKLNYKKAKDGTPTKEVESRVLKIGSRGGVDSIVRGLGGSLPGNSTLNSNIKKDTIKKRIEKFSREVMAEGIKRQPMVAPDILNEFISYWTEPTNRKDKFRKELEKTWCVKRRLNTWLKRNNDYTKIKQSRYERNLDTTILNKIKSTRV